jgi:regulator of protease activity HflC (stomatin/prohibitin superfamily)
MASQPSMRMRHVLFPVRVVSEYQRIVVFRLGRSRGIRGPGLAVLLPFIDRYTVVDLREFFIEIPHQTSITKDNASISIDFLTFFRVVDVEASVLRVADLRGSAQNIAATTLRSVVGDITLDNVLAQRDEINNVLRVKLDEVTERWGVQVTNVEIREIIPPPAVQEAMTRQMSAERSRRAVVTEAEGVREAAVLRAEGEKQAQILEAEGERQAVVLRSQGFADALTAVFHAAEGVDAKTMTIQYLEALKALGASPATKFVLPLELTGLAQGMMGFAGQALSNGVASPPMPAAR